MALHSLPPDTVRLIKSTQVITTPASIVKELVENSLDAKATAVCVRMESYGFSRLEVRDNGSGVCEEDMEFIAKPHYTSKISSFCDLASLTSYGFRGEALSSLCAVAEVTVTTKTKESSIGYMYFFDHEGNITSRKPTATSSGTTVVVSNLFKKIPVRRQFYSNSKRCREELKKVEDLVLAICLAVPNVHLTLMHDKINIIQKNPSLDLRAALMNTFPSVFKDLISKTKKIENIQLEMYLPKPKCCSKQNIRRSTTDRLFILVNQRPVSNKAIQKIVKAHYSQKSEGCHGHYPTGVVALSVPPDTVDINLEPNKDKVLLKDEEIVFEILHELLTELYGPAEKLKKSDGKKRTEGCLEANSDITCTLSCVSQPQEKTNSPAFEKCNQSKNNPTFQLLSEENNHVASEDEEFDGPCIRSTVLTTNQVPPDKRNGEVPTRFRFISERPGALDGLRERNVGPQSSHSITVKEGLGFKSLSPDKAVVNKAQQLIASGKSNKENTDVKKNLITSTQNSKTDGIFPSLSESCISLNGDLGNHLEKTSSDFSALCSGDSRLLDSDKQVTSGVVPLSFELDSSCNDAFKANEMSKTETIGWHVSSKNDQQNVLGKSQSKHDTSHLHESLIGSDGIPVFKIAPLPPSENVCISTMDDQTCQILRKEKGNSDQINHSTISKERQDSDSRQTAILLKTNTKELQKLPSQEETSELYKTSMPEKGSWSKGQIINEENIQTVRLVKPNDGTKSASCRNSFGSGLKKRTRPSSSTEIQASQTAPPKKTKLNSLGPACYDYVHGKPVKKASSPFILFSRDIRTHVLSENPGADFAFIAKDMASRWKAIDCETKAYYIDQAKIEADRYQEEVRKIKESRNPNNTLNSSLNKSRMTKASLDRTPFMRSLNLQGCTAISIGNNRLLWSEKFVDEFVLLFHPLMMVQSHRRYVAPLTPQLAKSNRKSIEKQSLLVRRPWLEHQKEVHVAVDTIKEMLNKNGTDSESCYTFRLLGPLTVFGGWICLKDRNIIALNTSRLSETLLVHMLLKTFKFPVSNLTNSIPFNASVLGTENWNQLLRLQREQVPNSSYYTITDHRILSNGFKIALYPGTSSSSVISHGEIVAMTNVVGYYGVNDLKELLSTLVLCPSSCIEKTRPLKVQHWIKGEAVRMVRSGPNIVRREDVCDKLEKWHKIQKTVERVDRTAWENQNCIHSKPIFTPIYCLDDLPQSQGQSQSQAS